MEKKTFEEQFLSLKGKEKYLLLQRTYEELAIRTSENLKEADKPAVKDIAFPLIDIQKHCLDKEKVREVIDKQIEGINKIIKPSRQAGKNIKYFLLNLKKELKL